MGVFLCKFLEKEENNYMDDFIVKANEISFNIELQGELTQQNRVNPLKNSKRGIIIKTGIL